MSGLCPCGNAAGSAEIDVELDCRSAILIKNKVEDYDTRRGQRPTPSRAVVTKYQKRISGPLLDRIDIHIEVPSGNIVFDTQLPV